MRLDSVCRATGILLDVNALLWTRCLPYQLFFRLIMKRPIVHQITKTYTTIPPDFAGIYVLDRTKLCGIVVCIDNYQDTKVKQ